MCTKHLNIQTASADGATNFVPDAHTHTQALLAQRIQHATKCPCMAAAYYADAVCPRLLVTLVHKYVYILNTFLNTHTIVFNGLPIGSLIWIYIYIWIYTYMDIYIYIFVV